MKNDSWLQKKFEIPFKYNNEVKTAGRSRKMFNGSSKRSRQHQEKEISKICTMSEIMYVVK